MSEENQTQVPEQNIQPQSEAIKPLNNDLDRSLDEALAKAFETKAPEPKVNEQNEKKSETTSTPEQGAKPEESKQTTPAKLPDPESISETPSGRKVSPESKQGWDSLKANYKTAHKMAQDREKEIIELKKSLADKSTVTSKEVEEYKKQIEELNKYRAMVDIQADPEFISKFDEPIKQRMQDIKDLLIPHNVSEEVIKNIDYKDSKAISEIASIIRKERGDVDADDFLSSARELRGLMTKRDKASKEQGENYKQYIETKKKDGVTKQAEEEGRMIRHLENTVKDKSISFLIKKEVKDGASKAELEQINNHNNLVDMMSSKVDSVMKMKSPEERAEVAIAAVASHWFSAKNAQLEKKVASLEAELKKVSSINSETESPRAPKRQNGSNLDLDAAMAEHFANK